MNKKLINLFLAFVICFSCCPIALAKSPDKIQEKQKGVIPSSLEKIKKWGKEYKIQLEIKNYQERLKLAPNDIELLETYSKYMKDHKYYDEALKANSRLLELTKNNIYKKDTEKITSSQVILKKENLFLSYITEAQKYESQGNIVRANDYYLKAQKVFPGRYEAKFGLAKTYCWLGLPKISMKNYQELLTKSPDNINLLEAYAKCLKENKDYNQALKIYAKLFDLTKNEKYYINLNEIIALKKSFPLQQNTLELSQATNLDKVFLGYIKQAQKHESQGQIRKANEYYLKAQKESPHRFEARFGLAKTYWWLGQKKLANFYYKELLKEEPNNPDLIAAYNKFSIESKEHKGSKVKIAKNTPGKAKQGYSPQDTNKEKYKAFIDYIKQAQDYEKQGKVKEANEYYLKASDIYPSKFEAKFGLAKTYGWLNEDTLALNYYQELLIESPNSIDLLDTYASYLKENKYYLDAMEIYKKLFAKSREEKYKENIAEIYFLQKDYKTSLKLYYDIYNKNPNNPKVQKAIALVYFVSGDFEKSICFYQKYLTQNYDPESLLNYGKSLFYSKQIQPAKVILENYVCAYPNDIEGLSTLADIYVAIKEPLKAMELVTKAINIEPDNIKLQIQTAKIDITMKSYCKAQTLLLNLLTIEANNTDIIENLGDISFNTGKFAEALGYYRCIPDFKTNKRLIYKIAKSYHYGNNHAVAQNLYRSLVLDPEYVDRAKIGLAEIQITKDKPLKARAILSNVLQDDPENVQAKKNLAISFYSTGDYFNSIEILKTLPTDDSDINYNLAKAYNGIERKDKALNLLKDNPQENAKALEAEILMQTRPAIEPIYNLYRMTGNANAGKYQKAGGNGYVYLRPNLRTVGTIVTTQYKNVTNIVSTQGTLYSVGLEGRPHDHIGVKSAIGVQEFSNNGNIILGNAVAKFAPNDLVTMTSGYIRSLDEIDSYMSAAGVIPTVGPFANQLVGRIIDNKYVVCQLGFKLPRRSYAYTGFNVGTKYGANSPSNFYKEIGGGLGKVIYSAAEERHINQALVAYDFYYTGYNRDMSGFGGANLNNDPVGSDGGSPTPSAGNPGTGGYFSPTFFISQKIPLTIKGSFKKTKLKYVVSGFMGLQIIDGPIGLVGGGSGYRKSPYYGYLVGLRYNENGKYSMGLDYTFNNYMTVAQHLLKVNLLIRF